MSTISVVIPCFNVATYIDECVQSVVNQVHHPIEIICIDNDSTDQTLNRLIALKDHHDFIQILAQPHQGASAARNMGLSVASGEWVQFLDADDLLELDKLSHQIDIVDENIDIIVGASYHHRVTGEIQVRTPIDDPWYGIFSTNFGNTCSNLWRKSKLIEVKGWDEKISSSQEYDLMFRMLVNDARVVIDTQPKTIIRERSVGSISKSEPGAKWKRYLELRLRMIQWLKQNKSDYLISKEEIYLQKLFEIIRFLYPHDEEEALIAYREFIRDGFQPQTSPVNSIFYVYAFRMLGFERTEKLRRIFSNRISQ